jgi:uncharacterized protein (DUF2249 family)
MKTYAGHRRPDGHAVVGVFDNTTDKAHEVPLRLGLFNHSPTGFEWGYGGSGPSQLALAILADVLKDDAFAVRLHQEFKWRYVANFKDAWRINEFTVSQWVQEETKRRAQSDDI